jgi:hypothetical protein
LFSGGVRLPGGKRPNCALRLRVADRADHIK